MPATLETRRARQQHVDDVPGQQLLPFAPLAGKVMPVLFELHYPSAADPAVVNRIERTAKRLSRGAQAGKGKLTRAAALMEQLAGLFDGASADR